MTKIKWFGLVLWLICGYVLAGESMSPVEPPKAVADFTLPGIDGNQQRLKDLQGKYVLVNFWAVWCGPCRAEMPSLDRAYQQLKGDQFELLAIHAGPSMEHAQGYAEELKLTFPIVVDEDLELTSWGVRGLPTTFLIDPEGRIVAEAVGERVWDDAAMLKVIRDYME
ncbi:TlpA disulfide reductase family protein [Sedimenticola thiotaurini]|uniref:Thioredoxin domain-containing protein n=1 Tax=Sedimenticola thiotaurini TaxID=1543721 RepID=A0A0F7JWS5_9GAMM|nr:TlpA disulfide reductase family protein [Sedimenticola thiotaurini]AKH19250.1 hypothetical protein AAY24_01595 [Sedimenticola thiotaurini]